jgi:hypothetical protein
MKGRLITLSVLLAGVMGLALLAGCGTRGSDSAVSLRNANDLSSGAEELSPEEALEATAIEWNGYTMHLILVSDAEKDVKLGASENVEGRLLKLCFAFDSSTGHPGGFDGRVLLNDLQNNPIKLVAKDGTTAKWTGSISNIKITGDFLSNDITIAKDQPVFSIFFDIPLEQDIESYELSIGSQKVSLIAMESPDYSKSTEST